MPCRSRRIRMAFFYGKFKRIPAQPWISLKGYDRPVRERAPFSVMT